MWPQIIISSGKGTLSFGRSIVSKNKAVEERSCVLRKKESTVLSEQEIFAELDALVGLRSVKEMLKEVYAFWEIQKCRKKQQQKIL